MLKDDIAEALKSIRQINKQMESFEKADEYVATADLITRLKNVWNELLNRMERLSTLESSIIVEHYVNLKTIHQIAREFFYSDRQIKRIITVALEKMAD